MLGVFGGVGDVAFGGHRAINGGSRWVVLVVVRLASASEEVGMVGKQNSTPGSHLQARGVG